MDTEEFKSKNGEFNRLATRDVNVENVLKAKNAIIGTAEIANLVVGNLKTTIKEEKTYVLLTQAHLGDEAKDVGIEFELCGGTVFMTVEKAVFPVSCPKVIELKFQVPDEFVPFHGYTTPIIVTDEGERGFGTFTMVHHEGKVEITITNGFDTFSEKGESGFERINAVYQSAFNKQSCCV